MAHGQQPSQQPREEVSKLRQRIQVNRIQLPAVERYLESKQDVKNTTLCISLQVSNRHFGERQICSTTSKGKHVI